MTDASDTSDSGSGDSADGPDHWPTPPNPNPHDLHLGDPGPSVAVELNFLTEDVEPPLKGWLDRQLARVASLAGVRRGQLSVALVSDDRMTDLQQRYKGATGTTDVLSFDLRDDPADPVEADLVICLDQAAHNAQAYGHDTRLEVLLCAVHGLLHLIGYDDCDPQHAARMHRREDELLTQAGLGPVYDPKGHRP